MIDVSLLTESIRRSFLYKSVEFMLLHLVQICKLLAYLPKLSGILRALSLRGGSLLSAVAVVLSAVLCNGLFQAAVQARLGPTLRCLYCSERVAFYPLGNIYVCINIIIMYVRKIN